MQRWRVVELAPYLRHEPTWDIGARWVQVPRGTILRGRAIRGPAMLTGRYGDPNYPVPDQQWVEVQYQETIAYIWGGFVERDIERDETKL